MDKQTYYMSRCGEEVLSVYCDHSGYFDDGEIEFAIYRQHPDKLNLWERIQECVRILCGQPRFHDQIILYDEQAKELAMDLLGGLKSRRAARIGKKP